MKNIALKLDIDTGKAVLSSGHRVFKTAKFLFETRNFSDADSFFSVLAGGVILSKKAVFAARDEFLREAQKSGKAAPQPENADVVGIAYKLETENKEHAFFFLFGGGARQDGGKSAGSGGENVPGQESGGQPDVRKDDIVFFRYSGKETFLRRNDPALRDMLRGGRLSVTVEPTSFIASENDFLKLYRLSYSSAVNFPLLDKNQKSIVMLEDKNVLVQGVAGSGKTNLCIEKIVYSACRAYGGRVLYSTFSRGLLSDTRQKVRQFRENLGSFVTAYESGNVVFADADRKKALENRLGVYFSSDDSDEIVEKVKSVIAFLDSNVDYMLIEDFYKKYVSGGADAQDAFAGEMFFMRDFLKNLKNHQLLDRLKKTAGLSGEVVYKEIYGVIFGCFEPSKAAGDALPEMLTYEEYLEKRRDSFSKPECDIIYRLAIEYGEYLAAGGMTDNNLSSRRLLRRASAIPKYSLAIIDEVQDMTEVNLCFFRSISRRVFCVGDALQMINPSYFSFAYLKRLLFEEGVSSVAELSANYRNTLRIAELIEELGALNRKQFGTHSFVLKTSGIESETPTTLVLAPARAFFDELKALNFSNYTVIVSGAEEKDALRATLPKAEVLTVAEIKGLERDTVVLYNILSGSAEKWSELARRDVDRKRSDENSSYRYYFNLFYVGISRGRSHIFVAEDRPAPLFSEFFKDNFQAMDGTDAALTMLDTSDKLEAEQDEILARIDEFLRAEQYENARYSAEKILQEKERAENLSRIDIFERYVRAGEHREAGIRLWELGRLADAKAQFSLSGDETLLRMVDAAGGGDTSGGDGESGAPEGQALNADIIEFLPEVQNNEPAKRLIFRVLRADLDKMRQSFKNTAAALGKIKSGN